MRAWKYLFAALVIAIIGAACQAGGNEPPETFPPVTQPPGTSTPTTTPPTTNPPVTTPPTTTPGVKVSYLPDVAADVYQIFGVSGDHVTVTKLPGDTKSGTSQLTSKARDIAASGKRASVEGKVYFEIKLVDGSMAWIDATALVHQVTALDTEKPANFVVSGLSKGDKLNVRSYAGVDHGVVNTLSDGAVVKATGHRAKVQGSIWREIQLTSTSTGWVNASYLAPEVVYLADEAPATYRVTGLNSGGSLNVRKGPGTHMDAVVTLAFDATDLAATGKRAEVGGGLWRQIKLSDGTLGWVSATYVELQPAPMATTCSPGGDDFCPDLGASRGAVAAFISRAAGLRDSGGKDWFADDNGSLFEDDINRLATAGIAIGCNPPNNTQVCPTKLATRATAAAWFSRAMGLSGDGGKDWFTDDNGSTFETDINRLADAGVARACDGGSKFCPDSNLSRGQLAAWTVRAFHLPASSTDYFADDDGSIFEADINAVAAAGITRL